MANKTVTVYKNGDKRIVETGSQQEYYEAEGWSTEKSENKTPSTDTVVMTKNDKNKAVSPDKVDIHLSKGWSLFEEGGEK